VTGQKIVYWTNPSVHQFAGNSDPIELITKKAREEILRAIQAGWQGPPFDPFRLADFLEIPTIPREDVLDARIIPSGPQRVQIEFNPNRPRGRVRFSIAHEIAHTLFPDCIENVRSRGQTMVARNDDWQLELLCNIAAAEFLMPVGGEIDSSTPVTIDNLVRLQKEFDVSTEAISVRLAKVTLEPCTIFAAARVADIESIQTYRVDYSIPSRASTIELPRGLEIQDTILSQCTAVGYTSKGKQRGISKFRELYLECVGIPPYPGRNYPRVIAIARHDNGKAVKALSITSLRGNALEPRGKVPRIIAQIVNDKTPNWGAGFARAVRNKYPSVQKDFKEWAVMHRDKFSLGNTYTSMTSNELYVVNMIAQHGYGESVKPRIRYAALKDCLHQLREIAVSKRASVHMPRIGTGYAGGNWNYILELIDEILVRNGIDVTIYTLPDYEPTEAQAVLRLDVGTQAKIST
jgi:O-acetyl-ADP-ribose deacetylase (regulator of RNase III)